MPSQTPWIISVLLAILAVIGWGLYFVNSADKPEQVQTQVVNTGSESDNAARSELAGDSESLVQEWESRFSNLKDDYDSLKVENTGLISLNDNLNQRIDRLITEPGEDDSVETAELRNMVIELREEISSVKSVNEKLALAEDDDDSAKVSELQVMVIGLRKEIATEKVQNESLTAENQELAVLNNELDQRIDRLATEPGQDDSTETAELRNLIVRLQEENSSIKMEIEKLAFAEDGSDSATSRKPQPMLPDSHEPSLSENEALQLARSERETRDSAKTWQYSSLSGDSEYLSGRLTQASKQLRNLRAGLRSAQAENRTLNGSVKALEGRLANESSLNESMQQQIARLLPMANDQREQLSLANARNAELEEKLADSNEQFNQLRENLEAIEIENAQLAETGAELQKNMVEMESRLNELIPRVEEQEVQLMAKSEEVQSTSEELKAAALKNRELDEAIQSLKQDYSEEVSNYKLQIEKISQDTALITVASDIFFDSGSASLTAAGENALTLIFDELIAHSDKLVSFEGHSDSVPVSESLSQQYPTNWELSGARATAAARYLIRKGLPAERVRASAFGQVRPIADNNTEPGRARNRRLEIYLQPILPVVDS